MCVGGLLKGFQFRKWRGYICYICVEIPDMYHDDDGAGGDPGRYHRKRMRS